MTQILAAPAGIAAEVAAAAYLDPLAGMTGFRKAAVLMLQLGRVESAKVLGVLSETELEELTAEIARMGEVSREVSAAVLAEFTYMLLAGPGAARGGLEHARRMLIATVGERRANEILERISESMIDLPFSFLQH